MTTKTHKIAILNGSQLVGICAGAEDIMAAVRAEGDNAGFALVTEAELEGAERQSSQIDPKKIDIYDVFLSDHGADETGLDPIWVSGAGGALMVDGETYWFAYEDADISVALDDFAETEADELCRMLHNSTIGRQVTSQIYDFQSKILKGEINLNDLVGIREAKNQQGLIDKCISDYEHGAEVTPDRDTVIGMLEEAGKYDFDRSWTAYGFTLDALVVDALRDSDATEEEADAALQELDEELFVAGQDPYRDHRIKVGRYIDGRQAFVDVAHFDTHAQIVAWANAGGSGE